MSDFTYVSYTSYREDVFFGGFTRFQYNSNPGTITDPTNGLLPRLANDDTFQPTESFTLYPDPADPGVSVELTYFGTVEINGELMPVFESIYYGDLYVFSQNSAPLPTNLNTATMSENAEYQFNCFAEGTRIATPLGEIAIENLSPGDLVLTADGRAVPVRWVWMQRVRRSLEAEDRRMVRITAGALGHGLPLRDLVVTADHAMLLDGVLVNAGALADGDGVSWAKRTEMPVRYRVFHLETEAHEVLLAEGAPSESFIDYTNRDAYDNHAEFEAAGGTDRPIVEMPLPRISAARMLTPALRARLLGRAGQNAKRAA